MAALNSTLSVNDTAALVVVDVDAAQERLADLECGSIELVTNSTSLNAMKFYGQVSFGLRFRVLRLDFTTDTEQNAVSVSGLRVERVSAPQRGDFMSLNLV